MIRYNRSDTDKARKAIAALEKAKASNQSYNTPEVNDALAETFHGKIIYSGLVRTATILKMQNMNQS